MEDVENVRIPMEEDQCESSAVPIDESVVGNTLPSKYGESFDVMVENIRGVDDVLMDGIMEEMVTEGQGSGDEGGNKNESEESIDNEGYERPTQR